MVILAAAPLREEKAPGAAANWDAGFALLLSKCCLSAFFATRIRGSKYKFVKNAETC